MTTSYLDNFYARLGISRNASPKEIRDAYYRAAKRLHPDTNDTPAATELFLQIQEAYETLSNQIKRADYDQFLPDDIEPPPDIFVNPIYSREVLPISDSPQLIYVLLDLMASQENQGEENESKPPLNICLVLDTSTSMAGERLDAVKKTASNLIQDMGILDYLSIVSFNDLAEVIIPAGRGQDFNKVNSRISIMNTKGSTEIYLGLVAGMNELSKNLNPNYINQLILITDGRTYGDEIQSLELAEEAHEKGITISCLGIGHEWNDKFLDGLAAKTGGSCDYASKPSSIQNILNQNLDQMNQTFANNVSIYLEPNEDTELRYAFRISPNSSALEMTSPLNLGNIPLGGNLSVLLEFYIPEIKETSKELNLANGALHLTIPKRIIPKVVNKISFSRPATLNPEKTSPPQVIIKAMSRLSLYRMQELARDEIAEGKVAKATTRLNNLAVQLLTSGNPDLAHTIQLEIENIKSGNSLSEEAEKQIKYGTRALVFPQEKK